MPSIDSEQWRQLAWTSHANAHLAGGFPVDQWYRHGLFFDVAFSFRDWPSRALVAGGLFDWLALIESEGATHLSVETAPEIADHDILTADLTAVVVHYPDRRVYWRRSWERSMAWKRQSKGFITGRDAYQADVDAYFLMSTVKDAASGPAVFNWLDIRSRAHQRLAPHQLYLDQVAQINHPKHHQWLNRLPRADMPEWAKLAALPEDPALLIPHQLLQTLANIYGSYDNDRHPKNDSSALNHMALDEDGPLILGLFEDALKETFGEVYSAASSETRWRVPESAWRSPEALWERERAGSKRKPAPTSPQTPLETETPADEPVLAELPLPEPAKTPWAGMLILASLVGGAGYLAWSYPNTIAVIAVVAVFIYLLRR